MVKEYACPYNVLGLKALQYEIIRRLAAMVATNNTIPHDYRSIFHLRDVPSITVEAYINRILDMITIKKKVNAHLLDNTTALLLTYALMMHYSDTYLKPCNGLVTSSNFYCLFASLFYWAFAMLQDDNHSMKTWCVVFGFHTTQAFSHLKFTILQEFNYAIPYTTKTIEELVEALDLSTYMNDPAYKENRSLGRNEARFFSNGAAAQVDLSEEPSLATLII